MKKTIYLFATLFVITAIVSCSKETTNNDELDLLKKATIITAPIASQPVSLDEMIKPYIIPGANNGGNRTCAEVATAFGLNPNPFSCGEKINYVYYDEDGDDIGYYDWDGEFPAWLQVNVADDGKISFEVLYGCHKIGAVIVKGSNAANVYYYGLGGSTGDDGLFAPGGKMVSNLTFCCIPCDEELIIAVKVRYYNGSVWGSAAGENVFSTGWCGLGYLGINSFPFTKPLFLEEAYTDNVIGSVSLIGGAIKITLNSGLPFEAFIFIGTEEELTDPANLIDGCPDYENDWMPYVDW